MHELVNGTDECNDTCISSLRASSLGGGGQEGERGESCERILAPFLPNQERVFVRLFGTGA